jgi:hypothetical protein
VLTYPSDGVMNIIHCGGKYPFGRQSIIDIHNSDFKLFGKHSAECIVALQAAENPASVVAPYDYRPGGAFWALGDVGAYGKAIAISGRNSEVGDNKTGCRDRDVTARIEEVLESLAGFFTSSYIREVWDGVCNSKLLNYNRLVYFVPVKLREIAASPRIYLSIFCSWFRKVGIWTRHFGFGSGFGALVAVRKGDCFIVLLS